MRIYTLQDGRVSASATVTSLTINEVDIPVIKVGEKGRGRSLGIVAVRLLPEQQERFNNKQEVEIHFCEIGQTRTGRPKIIETTDAGDESKAIVVLRTPIGYRGSNKHSGLNPDDPFPGEILVKGIIAQGGAGRMGSGSQLVALIPAGVPFRTSYSGRRYGAPESHIYIYKSGVLKSYTQEEWELAEEVE